MRFLKISTTIFLVIILNQSNSSLAQIKKQIFTITIWETLQPAQIAEINTSLAPVVQSSEALKILKRQKTFGQVRIVIIVSKGKDIRPWLPPINKKPLEKGSYTYNLGKGGNQITSMSDFKTLFSDTLLMITRSVYSASILGQLPSKRFYLIGDCGGMTPAKVYLGFDGKEFIINPYFFTFCKQPVIHVNIYNDGKKDAIANCYFRLMDEDIKIVLNSFYTFLLNDGFSQQDAIVELTRFCNSYYGKIDGDQVRSWIQENLKR